ncbi:MAG: 16S rRNA (guanine(527)-N(7))-methyltransferase RsmG [Clostridiales bacterium]|nr:16S rRNA (guanine(527)-N(7))-methyltransferase RsmG [Clostridiales bacterium]
MEQLRNAFEQLKIPVGEEIIAKFKKYMDMVLSWNDKVNLTGITDEGEFVRKHLADSVLCACFDEVKNASRVIDVGTGAGLPGIPLALIFPEKQFLLIDSVGKKTRIVGEMAKELGLANVSLLHARAEDLARKDGFREGFDLCVSRAVARLAVLSEYCLPFVAVGGAFIAYKGPDASGEAEEAAKAVSLLGGEPAEIRKAPICGLGIDHSLVVVKKARRTPAKFPRKAGLPAKAPLLVFSFVALILPICL